MRTLLVLLTLTAAALAGCAGDDSGSDATTPTGTDDNTGGTNVTESPQTFQGDGVITASATVITTGGDPLDFTIGADATLLFAEIRWDDPVQDIDLALRSPDAGMTGQSANYDYIKRDGMPGDPDSPHSLTLTPSDLADKAWSGGWQASAFGNGVSANVEYEIAVSVFYGETSVPDGYTLFS